MLILYEEQAEPLNTLIISHIVLISPENKNLFKNLNRLNFC